MFGRLKRCTPRLVTWTKCWPSSSRNIIFSSPKTAVGVLLDFSGKEGESTRYHHTTFWPPAKNMVPLCPRRISILRLISSDPMLVCLDSTLLTVFVGESLNKCTYQSISWTFPVCACSINLGFASKDPEWWPKRVDSRNARTHLENGGREE